MFNNGIAYIYMWLRIYVLSSSVNYFLTISWNKAEVLIVSMNDPCCHSFRYSLALE